MPRSRVVKDDALLEIATARPKTQEELGKLRRLVDMPEVKVNLLGWDYDSTKWDKSHTTIVDGDYFVTRTTATSLRKYFDL